MNMFVEVQDKVYEIEDYYCVQPNCDCKEVQLVVFNDENENSLLSLWYNYAAKTLQIDETHEKSTPSEAILAEIKQKYEKVLTLNLPNRHQRLRKMFLTILLYIRRKKTFQIRMQNPEKFFTNFEKVKW